MTDSFQGSSLGFPTSKTNYLQTEADMAESVNKQIDENVKQMNAYFDKLIQISNEHTQGRSQQWRELANFTTKGRAFVNFARQKAEANADIQSYYDPNQYATTLKEEEETNQLEAEQNALHKESYTASAGIENTDPDLAKLLKAIKDGSITQKEALATGFSYSSQWYEIAQNTHLTEVAPGDWRTFNDPKNTALDRRIISADLDSTYISQFEDAGISKRYLKKYLIKPMMQQHEKRLLTVQDAHNAAQRLTEKLKRKDEFVTSFRDNPGKAIEDYLQIYNSYHAEASGEPRSGYVLAKAELQGFILDAIKNEEFQAEELQDLEEAFATYLLTPNDGGPPRTIGEYLPKFANPIKAAINQARLDILKRDEAETDLAIAEFESKYRNEWESRKEIATEEEVNKAHQEFRSTFGKNSKYFSDYLSKQDINDIDIDAELTTRYLDGEQIRRRDLEGITGVEMLAKWLPKITGGLSKTLIDSKNLAISSNILDRLWDQTLEKTKSNPQYEIIHTQAQEYFNAIYRKELETQDNDTAFKVARDETIKAIKNGDFDTRPIATRDESRATNILNVKKAIAKDNNIIYSADPWAGEEVELKSALKYFTTGKGSIPDYYYKFPNINLTPYELMQTRLVTTGAIKESDTKPIPERQLTPEQQDLLLNKPSPGRTNRALLNESGVENIEELLKLTGVESIEQLLDKLRSNAELNNQLNGINISLVNIDTELNEEHTQVVGEQPPFMRLNSLLPGVATAYVEDIYNV